ncbi:MAG TPA: DHA2 family efflux MFS transporter permease subunit [Steroidobacteraceae bacterium]|nr:DHA2 family efflux MFS transporter permease subunit [Steroidobacteraceae bacterium]
MGAPDGEQALSTGGAPPPRRLPRELLPWLVAVAFFMQSLDTTILNTAVPSIARALGVAPLSMKSVLSSYSLSLAVFIPISGWMANRFGTRAVFGGAIGLFALGSLLCGLARDIHWLVAFRILQGCGGAMMVPVGRLTLVRTFPKSELVRAMSFVAIPGLIGPMLGPLAGGFITGYLHWSVIFFINVPIGLLGLYLVYRHLPDFREASTPPLDVAGLLLFSSGIALLSYVLEVFGEHRLGVAPIVGLLALSAALLAGYLLRAAHTLHPLLNLLLFRVRTFRAAVSGSFFTRIAIGGVPFLVPLLYQVGLGYSPIQSGLLMMPQALAAISLKVFMPRILARYGYRAVLVANTLMLGVLIGLYATIGLRTPVWLIVVQAFTYGFLQSLQFTSMNTLVYADVGGRDAGSASTIASTAQQLSMSFGIAAASLVAAMFVPDRFHTTAAEMIHGVHRAFLVLGMVTIVSTVVFASLRRGDGSSVSQHQEQAQSGAAAASGATIAEVQPPGQ